jgi:uncharacterized membrane protein YkvA (DUF1232 family)
MTDRPFDPTVLPGHRPRAGFWRRARRLVRNLPLLETTCAAYYCARDPRTPFHARAALFGAIAYFIMPFDLIPDFIPVVAHIDDAAVMLLAIRWVTRHITTDHYAFARQRLDRFAE